VPFEGRVEVLYAGRWGTVCDDAWTRQNTLVVCRQLGYTRAVGFYYYGQGNETIWMDNVRCDGNETQLQGCTFNGWGNHDCLHYEDVGVRCWPSAGNTTRIANGRKFTPKHATIDADVSFRVSEASKWNKFNGTSRNSCIRWSVGNGV
jgi:hypothetical protein